MAGGEASLWVSAGFALAFLGFLVGWVGVDECWRDGLGGCWAVSVAGELSLIMKGVVPAYKR